MALKKKPVTGMKDIMPREMEIRDYVTGVIKQTYRSFGFTPMETPCVEHLANLNSKSGGENEKLIFRTLKRGEKLKINQAKTADDLSEEGLRYDLTVPLCRYYACHMEELSSPFKALQMGNVWRADRPQRGRYRQFMQCDIDILGDASNMAEIELILATSTCLGKLGFSKFTIRINDRRILKAMAAYAGFSEDKYDLAFIELDKMDKIGITGVREAMLLDGFSKEGIDKFVSFFKDVEENEKAGLEQGKKISEIDIPDEILPTLGSVKEILGDYLASDCSSGLQEIMDTVETTKQADFRLKFDPTLVRGMSYYTGTIFEISMDELGASVGGGGRYDEMVGKFIGQNVPACGFSIGFERIILILLESGFTIPGSKNKKAYLLDKKVPIDKKAEIIKKAMSERSEGLDVIVAVMKKNKKFQKEQLVESGYEEIIEVFND